MFDNDVIINIIILTMQEKHVMLLLPRRASCLFEVNA